LSYEDIQIEESDIKISADGNLVFIDKEDVTQSYLIWINTQYQSDFRDPQYGFKLQELLQSNDPDKIELLEMYASEVLYQHPRTESIDELIVTNEGNGKYRVSAKITLTYTEEQREIEVEYNF
jgi:phage baseplate assembly protein W